MIRTRLLGQTEISVTELAFGASGIGNLGHAVDDEQACATVDRAWELGVRLFDTAPHYGLGLSERRLGAALTVRPRDEFVVSTKVGRLLRPNPHRSGSDLSTGGFAVPDGLARVWDLSADGVRRSLDESLDRLGLSRIDVAYVHDPDHAVDQAITETIPALVELRDQGIVRAIGVGMNQWQALFRIVRQADVDVVMLAGRWTLLDRTGEPLLTACLERGIALVAAAPFNSGVLARALPPDDARYDYGVVPSDVLQRARELASVCEQFGTELPSAALQFPLRHPAVVAVVAGMRSPSEVTSAVSGMGVPINEELWKLVG